MRNLVKWQIIALIGVFIVSSCATSNDVVSGNLISKRKYNKGFHFNFHKNFKTTKFDEQVEEIETAAHTAIETEEVITQQESSITIPITSIEENIISTSSKHTELATDAPKGSVSNDNVASDDDQINTATKNTQKIVNFVEESKHLKSSSKRGDSDVKIVLLVILAFIISPLAMYLADGQTDLWFIVDLILYLMWFSVFFVANLYFASLAAIAIALLRIFDMI